MKPGSATRCPIALPAPLRLQRTPSGERTCRERQAWHGIGGGQAQARKGRNPVRTGAESGLKGEGDTSDGARHGPGRM